MNSNTLKSYQTKLNKLKAKQDVVKSELTSTQKHYNEIKSEIIEIQTKINNLKKHNELIVSEHATVRLVERLYEFDTKTAHKEIIDEILPYYQKLGNGIFPITSLGLRAIVKDGVVVTIE